MQCLQTWNPYSSHYVMDSQPGESKANVKGSYTRFGLIPPQKQSITLHDDILHLRRLTSLFKALILLRIELCRPSSEVPIKVPHDQRS